MGEETQKDNKKTKVYFGAKLTDVFHFPEDKDQYIEFKKLNEGERQQYEDLTDRSLIMDRNSDTVKMDLATGKSRKVLFKLAMVKYRVAVANEKGDAQFEEGSDVGRWETLIDLMDGDLAQDLFSAIAKLNPWLKPTEVEVKDEKQKN